MRKKLSLLLLLILIPTLAYAWGVIIADSGGGTSAAGGWANHYIVWDHVGSGVAGEGLNYTLIQLDNVNQTTPVNDEAGTQATPWEAAITSAANNLIVCFDDVYKATSADYGRVDWTNATETDGTWTNDNQQEYAINSAGSGVTVSVTDLPSSTYNVLACINVDDSGSAVTSVGSLTEWGTDTNTGSQSFTLNASAEILILAISGYPGTINFFTGSGQLPRHCDQTDCSGNVQTFAVSADYDGGGSPGQQLAIFELEDPSQ